MDINIVSNPGVGDKISVLVADDDPRILKFISASLRLAGFNVITVETGEEALKVAGSMKADIIVLDILMPLIDGFDVLKHLRSASNLPVLAISAHNSAAEKALSLGASDFLSKPFMPNELIKKIKALTNHRA